MTDYEKKDIFLKQTIAHCLVTLAHASLAKTIIANTNRAQVKRDNLEEKYEKIHDSIESLVSTNKEPYVLMDW